MPIASQTCNTIAFSNYKNYNARKTIPAADQVFCIYVFKDLNILQ